MPPLILQAEVAKQFGTNVDTEDSGMVTARKEFDEKKKALADAFGRKARALADVEDILGEKQQYFPSWKLAVRYLI